MDTSELRRGNFIKGCNDLIGTVTNINHSTVRYNVDNELENVLDNAEDIKPIPLTEDWLVKLGFKKRLQCYDVRVSEFKRLGLGLNGARYYYGVDGMSNGHQYYSNMIEYIGFVHQLQNLYFALTQKELELK